MAENPPEIAPVSSDDAGNRDDLAGTISQILDKYLQNNIDGMLPAQVVEFDADTNTVEVKPLIQLLQTDGTLVSRATLFAPVFYYGSGNMSLRFNLAAGDLGWIMANDRDLSNFLDSLEESAPLTLRKHNFSDCSSRLLAESARSRPLRTCSVGSRASRAIRAASSSTTSFQPSIRRRFLTRSS